MGLISRLKTIFYDDDLEETKNIEVNKQTTSNAVKEEPTIKVDKIIAPVEEKQVEVQKEVKEVQTSNTYSERELFKNKSTFNFPIFDDEDEVKSPVKLTPSSEIKKTVTFNNTSIKDLEKPKTVTIDKNGRIERKAFKPSPVISPVYGILDKNYKKEEIEIKENNNIGSSYEKNYDTVRRKAYGTLEEDLEDTFTKMNDELNKSVDELNEQIKLAASSSKNHEDLENLLYKINSKTSVGDMEERYSQLEKTEQIKPIKESSTLEEEKSSDFDTTLENDFFNLIDSMYDKEG